MLILVLLRPWLYLLKNFHVSTLHTHEYSGRQPSRLAAASCSLSGPSGGALFKNGRRTEARAQLLAGSIEFDQSGIHGSLLLLQHALALRAEGGWPSINAARAAWRHLLFPAATAYCTTPTPLQLQSPATSQVTVFFSYTTPAPASSSSLANTVMAIE